jgi:hypothetical protein
MTESLITDGTLIRLLPSVYKAMLVQIADVLFQVVSQSECFLADGGWVRFLPTVYDSRLYHMPCLRCV